MRDRNSLLQLIFQSKNATPSALREILQLPPNVPKRKRTSRRTRRRPVQHVSGVNNGNYFRIKVPEQSIFRQVRKLPPAANLIPKPLKHPSTQQASALALSKAATYNSGYSKRFYQWFKENLPVLGLNFGSMCILVGFSRSDVVELRSLAMTGQLLFAAYNLAQKSILWPSVAWSILFAGVNGVKIFEILHERHVDVHMNEEQEKIFVEHFMPHGVTPKQFEKLENTASKRNLKKGDFIIRKGSELDHVYLVCEGTTHAHILGRRLTAQSTSKETRGDQKEGGDSGAWVGEMTFLETFGSEINKNDKKPDSQRSRSKTFNQEVSRNRRLSLYSVLAEEDCTVMCWSCEDLEDLMKSSTDLRASLTRAMTSALVGKVVNLTISRSDGIPNNWSAWLTDWKNNDGASVKVRNLQKDEPE